MIKASGGAADFSKSLLRIAAGLGYFTHGGQKIFGWFGGFGSDNGTAELMTRFGAAGVLEVVLGVLIVLGLFTRPAAFVASGHMAVAYVWIHAIGRGDLFWWGNGGELAMVYSFVFLFFAATGPGSLSVDGLRRAASWGNDGL